MYFKAEILFFSICHAVEWNFGAGFVSDTEMQTLCAKFVTCTSFSCVPLSCVLSTVTLITFCLDPTPGLSRSSHACIAELGLLGDCGWEPLVSVLRHHAWFCAPLEFEVAPAGACLPTWLPTLPCTNLDSRPPSVPYLTGALVLLLCHEGKWKGPRNVTLISQWLRPCDGSSDSSDLGLTSEGAFLGKEACAVTQLPSESFTGEDVSYLIEIRILPPSTGIYPIFLKKS